MHSLPSIFKTRDSFLSLLTTNLANFNQILCIAITSGIFTDPFISSKLLNCSLSSQNKPLSFSRSLFSQIQNPNVFAWNFMLRSLSRNSLPHETIALYNQMRRNAAVPDNHTFPLVLKSCSQLSLLEKGRELHCITEKVGFSFDLFIQNALVFMYSQCGEIQSSWKVFKLVPDWVRDVVTYNSIISGYLQTDCQKALQVFGDLLNNGGVKPDGVTLASALTGCARIGLLDIGKIIHSLSIVWGLVVDVYVGSSLMDMYIKCGQLADARKVFDRIPQRNVVCWTRIISGYVQSGLYKEAMELFREMQVARIKAESATIASVASACGHLGVLDQGRWVHAYCEKHGLEKDLRVKNALIDMYSKCGQIEKALEIFRGLNYRDVFSWSSMISGLAMNEQSDKALTLFQEMEESGEVKPNEVIFLGVLSACSHSGFVKEGFHLLDKMSQHYNLIPSIEHYGCIVDLLGRANLLDEAEKFIRLLPIKPDAVMWRSLLFACRNNGNLELAELAAKRIDELDSQKAGGSVLLSNIYASASRWHDVKRIRNSMIRKKDPGCSFIEIDGDVHEFFVADDSHYEMDRIYDTVTKINEDIHSFDSYILDCDQYSGNG